MTSNRENDRDITKKKKRRRSEGHAPGQPPEQAPAANMAAKGPSPRKKKKKRHAEVHAADPAANGSLPASSPEAGPRHDRKKAKRDRLNKKKKLRKAQATAGTSQVAAKSEGSTPGFMQQAGASPEQEKKQERQQQKQQLEHRQQAEQHQEQQQSGSKRKMLKGWFPGAVQVKVDNGGGGGAAAAHPGCSVSIVLFYQYIEPVWSETRKQAVMQHFVDKGTELGIGGRARVAQEGVNCTLSGKQDALERMAASLVQLDPAFSRTDFKYIADLPASRHFAQLTVFPVRELVTYGIKDPSLAPTSQGGVHLEPLDFHKKMECPNTVIVDVRNFYEADIGNFNPATSTGASGKDVAKLVNPKMRQSTDFPDWLRREETKEELAGKTVLMYCTGGIRCERASALLRKKLGDQVQDVFQLQGGIEKYLLAFPDGGHWKGLNFTFDKRSVSAAAGAPAAAEAAGIAAAAAAAQQPLSKCILCTKPWDTYLGKHKCATCDSPVLLCTPCLDRGAHRGAGVVLRCPLCVEQGRSARERTMHHEVTLKAQTTTARLLAEQRAGAAGGRPQQHGQQWGGGKEKHRGTR